MNPEKEVKVDVGGYTVEGKLILIKELSENVAKIIKALYADGRQSAILKTDFEKWAAYAEFVASSVKK